MAGTPDFGSRVGGLEQTGTSVVGRDMPKNVALQNLLRRMYTLVFGNRFITPVVSIKLVNIVRYFVFFCEYRAYKQMEAAETGDFFDLYPKLEDRTPITYMDKHYFYQDVWAAQKIIKSGVKVHVDVGSRTDLIGFLTGVTKIRFVDIRPLTIKLDNFENIKGSILDLPFRDDSVASLSCLHVAEHIGLGRYGDPLDPLGTKKACRELFRVLARKGNLNFSLPVGKPRLCFNAHRIHSPGTIVEYFDGLELLEFSGIDESGNFIRNANIDDFENFGYACGLFHFTKSR